MRALPRVALAALLALALPAMASASEAVVYRDPSCGCCGAWISYLQAHGFSVHVVGDQPMAAVKARLGVPGSLASCHTAVISGYVIEGHVPVADIQALATRHLAARGLAAPGMPMGSPGMEISTAVPYQVMLIGEDGTATVFADHRPST